MKFFANENIPLSNIKLLCAEGLDLRSVLEKCSGETDSYILKKAAEENLIILTFDRDYGELIYKNLQHLPAAVIYLRFKPQAPDLAAKAILKLLDSGIEILGKFSVLELDKVRQRDLPRS